MADIEFSEEQAMLLETAENFCRDRAPIAVVRKGLSEIDTHDPQLWQEIAELGWLGISIPEAYGGLGLGLGEAVPIAEAMGRHLLSTPFLATTVAIQALISSASDAQREEWLPRLAGGAIATVALTEEDGNWNLNDVQATGTADGQYIALTGHKSMVLDAAAADLIVVSAKVDGATRLLLLERDQLPARAIVRQVAIDETRRCYDLRLDGAKVPTTALLPHTDLGAIEQAALLLISAEISGGMVGVLSLIVEYLNTRKQFDRLIGSYQALKHPTVDILLAAEACRSHLSHAATAIAAGDEHNAEVAVRMLKAQGSEAFAYAGDRAVQFHGGFGFTYECDAQLYLRRALWCQYQFGDDRHHRQLLAPLLLDAG